MLLVAKPRNSGHMKQNRKGFSPKYSITPAIAGWLMRIEAVRQSIDALPITPQVLASLRETARLFSTHYSTAIEGNLLTQAQVVQVVANGQHFPGRERDQAEVLGYYSALDEAEKLAKARSPLTEAVIRRLHALVMGGGKTRVKPTPYRDAQNVIQDSRSGSIVYLPPEAGDVPGLMKDLAGWLTVADDLPVPLKAAVAHYQFATIHPYYDGNGRTARLVTTLILHLGGYGLKGLYALEEYYACDLGAYYRALDIGSSHNYYMGRAEADVTPWVAYFVEGMASSFEKVQAQAQREAATGGGDQSRLLRDLDAKQRKAISLFAESREISSREIAALFGVKQRAASALCQYWVEEGFFVVANASNKARRYRLADALEKAFYK
jgi:Fic family protein